MTILSPPVSKKLDLQSILWYFSIIFLSSILWQAFFTKCWNPCDHLSLFPLGGFYLSTIVDNSVENLKKSLLTLH